MKTQFVIQMYICDVRLMSEKKKKNNKNGEKLNLKFNCAKKTCSMRKNRFFLKVYKIVKTNVANYLVNYTYS